ncbi:MAG: hypothetical protein ACXWP6_12130 [Ktedonobacterales bacterium]
MSLDDQLTEILTQLGVVLEEPTSGQHEQSDKRARYEYGVRRLDSGTSTDGSGKPSRLPQVRITTQTPSRTIRV